jgi:hypothetical protein
LASGATKNLPQGRNKVGLLVGFAQNLHLLALQVVAMHQLFCVSRRQQYLDAGLEFPGPVGIPTKVSSCTEHDVHSLTKMTGGDGALADGTAGCIS